MLDRYPFIIPIFIVWLIGFFIPIILVFYTKTGLKNIKFFNRGFLVKFTSVTLFFVFILIMLSGFLQLLGENKIFFNKSDNYWHALVGYLFILTALNHIVIHIKDIYRYIFKSRKKKIEQT
ncbi:MAG: hypothetical protein Q8P20_08625 [bacterium]|nr:hypothetical protein [bacterium]